MPASPQRAEPMAPPCLIEIRELLNPVVLPLAEHERLALAEKVFRAGFTGLGPQGAWIAYQVLAGAAGYPRFRVLHMG